MFLRSLWDFLMCERGSTGLGEQLEEKIGEREEEESTEAETTEEEETESQEGLESEEDEGEQSDEEAAASLGIDPNADYKLPSGETIKGSELAAGYLREKDYTQKTQELSEARRQLDLAHGVKTGAKGKATEAEDEEAIKMEEDNEVIKQALDAMDDDDPQKVILKSILDRNNKMIKFINNQSKAQKQTDAQAQSEQFRENFMRLTNETIDGEAKNYNLPKVKLPDGAELDFQKEWRDSVVRELGKTDQEMTLPEYKALIRQTGKKAYARVRSLISAVSKNAKQEEQTKEGEGEQTAKSKQKKQTPSEQKPRPIVNVREALNNAFDKLGKK